MVLLGGFANAVENDARFDGGKLAVRIEQVDGAHVLGEVEDDGGIATLTGETGASTPREDRSSERAADGDGGDDVGGIARNYDACGNLTVIGGICCIQCTRTGVETNFSADGGGEAGLKLTKVMKVFVGET
jgi:hypothetical protein